MWFYVPVMAVKCYFEMQMNLWLRDIHEKGVVYEVAVWKPSPGRYVVWSHLVLGDLLLKSHADW